MINMLNESVAYIKSVIADFEPEIGIVLGSGLGDLADEYCDIAINYSDIPGFEASTVKGHKGRLVFATIAGRRVVMMQGRFHFYEGHSIQKVVFPTKVMKKLGVKIFIVTNAAGGVNVDFKPADLMLITDHINFMGTNPLIGENDDSLGDRFPDMTEVYSKRLVEIAKKCAQNLGTEVREGVYIAMSGPTYETPAEVKMVRTLGADAVGMSTVPEATVAYYCKMEVLGISCICNAAAGVSSSKLSHAEVIDAANTAKDKFKKLVLEVIADKSL